jgi:uncharacterized protein with HEPN domain
VKGRGRGDRDRLSVIGEAIDEIAEMVSGGRRNFEASRRDQLAVRAALEIVGEAARNLSESLRAHHPEVEWQWLIEFRNRAIHEYFQITAKELWEIASGKLPALRQRLRRVRAE